MGKNKNKNKKQRKSSVEEQEPKEEEVVEEPEGMEEVLETQKQEGGENEQEEEQKQETVPKSKQEEEEEESKRVESVEVIVEEPIKEPLNKTADEQVIKSQVHEIEQPVEQSFEKEKSHVGSAAGSVDHSRQPKGFSLKPKEDESYDHMQREHEASLNQQKIEKSFAGASSIDVSDSISAVSYSASTLFGQGKEIDLANIQQEFKKREDKIRDLIQQKKQHRELLKKAKGAIDELHLENKTLKDKLTQQQLERQGISMENVSKILAHVMVEGVGYTLIQTSKHQLEWFQDTQILNIKEGLQEQFWACGNQLNYDTYEQEKKKLEDQLQQCINQYEERLKRAYENIDQGNNSYQKSQDDIKSVQEKISQMKNQEEDFLSKLIDSSVSIKSLLANEAERVKRNKKTSLDRLNETAQSLQKALSGLMEIQLEGDQHSVTFNQLQDHLLQIYRAVGLGFIKKSMAYEEHLNKQEIEWQATCDTILQKMDQQKAEKEKVEQNVRQMLENSEAQLVSLKKEHHELLKDSNSLQERLENSVNQSFLKNILYKYLTTDEATVQANLLNVIFKAMKFEQEEQEEIMESHENKNKSSVEKLVNSFW